MNMITDFFRKLSAKPQTEPPPDLKRYNEAKARLLKEVDAFGSMVNGMQGRKRKCKTAKKETSRK